MKYYIFKGRFQPFHNGHLEVVERTLKLMDNDDILILAAVSKPSEFSEIADMEFDMKVSEHFLPERNPWGVLIALEAISKISKIHNESDRIITTIMPVPNYAWHLINDWIPDNRVWVIPDSDEKFDNDKADFYLRKKEIIIRVPDFSGISGKELRDAYFTDDYVFFSKRVPSSIVNIYWKKT